MPISQPWLPPDSVLHGIEPYEWNQEEVTRYEVAIEIINDEVGAINGVLYRLKADGNPDPELEREARKARDLRSADTEGVAAVWDGARERIARWNSGAR